MMENESLIRREHLLTGPFERFLVSRPGSIESIPFKIVTQTPSNSSTRTSTTKAEKARQGCSFSCLGISSGGRDESLLLLDKQGGLLEVLRLPPVIRSGRNKQLPSAVPGKVKTVQAKACTPTSAAQQRWVSADGQLVVRVEGKGSLDLRLEQPSGRLVRRISWQAAVQGSPNGSPGKTKVKKQLPSGLVTEVYAHPWEWQRLWVRDDGCALLALSSQGPGIDLWLWTGFEGVATAHESKEGSWLQLPRLIPCPADAVAAPAGPETQPQLANIDITARFTWTAARGACVSIAVSAWGGAIPGIATVSTIHQPLLPMLPTQELTVQRQWVCRSIHIYHPIDRILQPIAACGPEGTAPQSSPSLSTSVLETLDLEQPAEEWDRDVPPEGPTCGACSRVVASWEASGMWLAVGISTVRDHAWLLVVSDDLSSCHKVVWREEVMEHGHAPSSPSKGLAADPLLQALCWLPGSSPAVAALDAWGNLACVGVDGKLCQVHEKSSSVVVTRDIWAGAAQLKPMRLAMCIRTTASSESQFLLLTDGERVVSCALTYGSQNTSGQVAAMVDGTAAVQAAVQRTTLALEKQSIKHLILTHLQPPEGCPLEAAARIQEGNAAFERGDTTTALELYKQAGHFGGLPAMLMLLHIGQDLQAAQVLQESVVSALKRRHNLPRAPLPDSGSPGRSLDIAGKQKPGKSADARSQVRTLDLSGSERTSSSPTTKSANGGLSPGRYLDLPNATASKMARQLSGYLLHRLEQGRSDVMQLGFWKPLHAVGLLLYAKGFQGVEASAAVLSSAGSWGEALRLIAAALDICPVQDTSFLQTCKTAAFSATAAALKQSGQLPIQEEVALVREVAAFSRFLCAEHSGPAVGVMRGAVADACCAHISRQLSKFGAGLPKPCKLQWGTIQGELCRHILAAARAAMSSQKRAEQAGTPQGTRSYSSLTSAVVEEPRVSAALRLLSLLTGQDNLHDSIVSGLEDSASEQDTLEKSGTEDPAKAIETTLLESLSNAIPITQPQAVDGQTSLPSINVLQTQVHLVVWSRLVLEVCGSMLRTALRDVTLGDRDGVQLARQCDLADNRTDETGSGSCSLAVNNVLDVMWVLCDDSEEDVDGTERARHSFNVQARSCLENWAVEGGAISGGEEAWQRLARQYPVLEFLLPEELERDCCKADGIAEGLLRCFIHPLYFGTLDKVELTEVEAAFRSLLLGSSDHRAAKWEKDRLVAITHDKSVSATTSETPSAAASAKPLNLPPGNPASFPANPIGSANGSRVSTLPADGVTMVDPSSKHHKEDTTPREVNVVATVPRSSFYAPFLAGGGSGAETDVAGERNGIGADRGARERTSEEIRTWESNAAELVELSLLDDEDLTAAPGGVSHAPPAGFPGIMQFGEGGTPRHSFFALNTPSSEASEREHPVRTSVFRAAPVLETNSNSTGAQAVQEDVMTYTAPGPLVDDWMTKVLLLRHKTDAMSSRNRSKSASTPLHDLNITSDIPSSLGAGTDAPPRKDKQTDRPTVGGSEVAAALHQVVQPGVDIRGVSLGVYCPSPQCEAAGVAKRGFVDVENTFRGCLGRQGAGTYAGGRHTWGPGMLTGEQYGILAGAEVHVSPPGPVGEAFDQGHILLARRTSLPGSSVGGGTTSRELSTTSQHPALPASDDDSLLGNMKDNPLSYRPTAAAHSLTSDIPLQEQTTSGDKAKLTSPSDVSPQEIQAITAYPVSTLLNLHPNRLAADTDTDDKSSPSSPKLVQDISSSPVPVVRASSQDLGPPVTLLNSERHSKFLSPSRLWRPKSLQSLLPWRRSQTSLDAQTRGDPPHPKGKGQPSSDLQPRVETLHPAQPVDAVAPSQGLRTSRITSFPWLSSKRTSQDLVRPQPSHEPKPSGGAHATAAAQAKASLDMSDAQAAHQAEPQVEAKRYAAVPRPRQVSEVGCQVDDSNPAVNSPLAHGLPRVQSHIAVWVPDALEPPFFMPSPITRSPVNPPTLQLADLPVATTTPPNRTAPQPPVAPRRSLLHAVTHGRWRTGSGASTLEFLPHQPRVMGTQEAQTASHETTPTLLPAFDTLRIRDVRNEGNRGATAGRMPCNPSHVGGDGLPTAVSARPDNVPVIGSIPGGDVDSLGGPHFSPSKLIIPRDPSADMANHSPLAMGLTQREQRMTDGSTTPEGSVAPTPRVYSPLQDGMFGRRGWLRPSALFTSNGGTPRDACNRTASGKWPTWMHMHTERPPDRPLEGTTARNNPSANSGEAEVERVGGESEREDASGGTNSARIKATEGGEEGLHGSGMRTPLVERGEEGHHMGGSAADPGRGSLRDITGVKANRLASTQPVMTQKPEERSSARNIGKLTKLRAQRKLAEAAAAAAAVAARRAPVTRLLQPITAPGRHSYHGDAGRDGQSRHLRLLRLDTAPPPPQQLISRRKMDAWRPEPQPLERGKHVDASQGIRARSLQSQQGSAEEAPLPPIGSPPKRPRVSHAAQTSPLYDPAPNPTNSQSTRPSALQALLPQLTSTGAGPDIAPCPTVDQAPAAAPPPYSGYGASSLSAVAPERQDWNTLFDVPGPQPAHGLGNEPELPWLRDAGHPAANTEPQQARRAGHPNGAYHNFPPAPNIQAVRVGTRLPQFEPVTIQTPDFSIPQRPNPSQPPHPAPHTSQPSNSTGPTVIPPAPLPYLNVQWVAIPCSTAPGHAEHARHVERSEIPRTSGASKPAAPPVRQARPSTGHAGAAVAFGRSVLPGRPKSTAETTPKGLRAKFGAAVAYVPSPNSASLKVQAQAGRTATRPRASKVAKRMFAEPDPPPTIAPQASRLAKPGVYTNPVYAPHHGGDLHGVDAVEHDAAARPSTTEAALPRWLAASPIAGPPGAAGEILDAKYNDGDASASPGAQEDHCADWQIPAGLDQFTRADPAVWKPGPPSQGRGHMDPPWLRELRQGLERAALPPAGHYVTVDNVHGLPRHASQIPPPVQNAPHHLVPPPNPAEDSALQQSVPQYPQPRKDVRNPQGPAILNSHTTTGVGRPLIGQKSRLISAGGKLTERTTATATSTWPRKTADSHGPAGGAHVPLGAHVSEAKRGKLGEKPDAEREQGSMRRVRAFVPRQEGDVRTRAGAGNIAQRSSGPNVSTMQAGQASQARGGADVGMRAGNAVQAWGGANVRMRAGNTATANTGADAMAALASKHSQSRKRRLQSDLGELWDMLRGIERLADELELDGAQSQQVG